jgi:methionyl-tRNA formyltransferase
VNRISVLAIGRSGLLFDAIESVAASDLYRVAAVVTDDAYVEYDVGVADFRALAARLGAEFVVSKTITPVLADELIARHHIEIGISANWRYLIPASVLTAIPNGILNLHLGRLPDYKGNATVNWAIIAGEPEIYADVHVMAPELDAGDIMARAVMILDDDTYVGDVLDWTRREAPGLFLAALDRATSRPGSVVAPGSPEGLRCYPRSPEDGAIDWRRSATDIGRLVRASGRPYPGAFCRYRDTEITVWRARAVPSPGRFLAAAGQVLGVDREVGSVDVACGAGVLRLEEIEVDGRAIRPADAIRGLRARLESAPAGGLPEPMLIEREGVRP